MYSISFHPLSETAILIDFGDDINRDKNKRILQLSYDLNQQPFPGFVESVPAYTTLTVYYNPLYFRTSAYQKVCSVISIYLSDPETGPSLRAKSIKIPVCYDGNYGPDLYTVAAANDLTKEKVIQYHTAIHYHVYFLGFTPGFPFLGGLDKRISTPRQSSPRASVPPGSVGIAGNQTGIYPIESPGGWQIIGRTPLQLLNLENQAPTLFQPGDTVTFYPISESQFSAWEWQPWD